MFPKSTDRSKSGDFEALRTSPLVARVNGQYYKSMKRVNNTFEAMTATTADMSNRRFQLCDMNRIPFIENYFEEELISSLVYGPSPWLYSE